MPVAGGGAYIERCCHPGTHDEDWLLGMDEATKSDNVVASREANRRSDGSVDVRIRGGALSAAEARAPTAGGRN